MSLFDWFRPKPKQPPSMETAIVEALRAAGLIPEDAEAPHVIVQRGQGSPPDPADSWAKWQEAMEDFAVGAPGWSPCMMAIRLCWGDAPDRVHFMFGVVKGHFGVYTCARPVGWHTDDPELDAAQPPTEILATLAHLGSGIALGTFTDRSSACQAADSLLTSRVDVPWESLTGGLADLKWHVAKPKIEAALGFNGFCVEQHRHFHLMPGAPEEGIWAKTAAALIDGKPEKLS